MTAETPGRVVVDLVHDDGTQTRRTTPAELIPFWAEMPTEPESHVLVCVISRAEPEGDAA